MFGKASKSTIEKTLPALPTPPYSEFQLFPSLQFEESLHVFFLRIRLLLSSYEIWKSIYFTSAIFKMSFAQLYMSNYVLHMHVQFSRRPKKLFSEEY
jgi:hypothetical protein